MGMYPQQTVPTKVQLTVRIGFISGATGTDGALFKVYFDEFIGMQVPPTRHTVISQFATLNNALDMITKDLGYLAGRKGNFILYVNAGQTSDRDWAVWVEVKIESTAMPDLVITDIIRSDGSIRYKVKNIGDAATTAKSFCNSLNVDGEQVAEDTISQALQPGQEVERGFDYAFQPEPGQHVIRVCADSKQNVDESNEQNNCLEETWVEERLPDFVIIEVKCDRNNSVVGYVLKNIGDETAGGGHQTTLYVNGKEETHDMVGVDIKSGETYESWFKEYEWPECHNISVKVCADNYNQVKESNEANNYLERTCISAPISIMINSGPSAVNVTQDTVTIIWVTNKRSDSLVIYSDRSTGDEGSTYDANPVKGHRIVIKDLKPRTTYRFHIESKDSCGNSVIRKGVFETGSPPDDESPSVSLFLPERLGGVVDIFANASDNVGVGGVMFSIDGRIKFIDFSPPYAWSCNTTSYDNGLHGFGAEAFDFTGNEAADAENGTIDNPALDTTPPAVSIVNPPDGDTVVGVVRIEAIVQDMALIDRPLGHIQRAEIYVDGVCVYRWVYSPFHFDVLRGEMVTEHPTSSLTLTHLWNATALEAGSEHRIEVRGWDDSGNEGRAIADVTIMRFEWLPPALEVLIIDVEVTREVVRYGNWFDVSLTIRNTGNKQLDHFRMRDMSLGFQAIALPMPMTSRDTNVSYHDWMYSEITITPLMVALNPGEAWTFHYYAVPILFCSPRLYDDAYTIGFITYVEFQWEDNSYRRTFELPYSPGIEDEDRNGFYDLDDAFRGADYLLITHPRKLFDQNPADPYGVNLLLQEMATLAKVKNGILGYLRGEMTADEIKPLILPSGDWAVRLDPAFRDPNPDRGRDAYVLIVGETEVVPSYTMDSIKLCDLFYGDVVGDGAPDLILGRIIGDNAMDLIKPIQTSIDVALGDGFDRSFALGVSGYEDGGYAVHAVDIARNVVSDLADQGVPGETLHWSTFIRYAWGVRFTDYDAFTLGDIDGDDIDEAIMASDEYGRMYVYETTPRSLIRDFPCAFTRYDGLAAGDLDGDGVDEIAIAVNPNEGAVGTLYVYDPDGSLIDSREVSFANWDAIAIGDVVGTGWTEGSWIEDDKDEIALISEGRDAITIYVLNDEGHLKTNGTRFIDIDFTRYDGFAVGNIRPDWGRDEIAIIRDDDECVYLYNANGRRLESLGDIELGHIRYTTYDGFAVGDVNDDRKDELVIVCDDDKAFYVISWNGTHYSRGMLFTRFLDDWFHGIRYTGSPTRHDCLAIGKVIPDENQKIAILLNLNGDISSFGVFISNWYDADHWANMRINYLGYANDLSFLTVYGHGNPGWASPLGTPFSDHWGNFERHPFVLAFSCLSGNYEDWGDSLGEAFFRHGAAVFAGATEVSYCCENENVGLEYYERWDVWNMRAGKAYTIFERHWYRTVGNFWARVFNYYGDPKFPTGG